MVTQGDGGAVRWTVLKDGKQVLRMVATVTPEGEDASRVAVAIEPPNNDGNSAIGRKMADNPAIVRLYKSAMAEQIDAKLNNRAFNMAAIQGEMMGAALASMPKIQEQAAEAARSSAEMERQIKQNAAEAAYEREHRAAMAGYGDDGVGSAPSY
jgi:chemotaxis response regulator CheB